MHSQLNKSQLKVGVSLEPTDEHQMQSAGIGRTRKSEPKSIATGLFDCVYDDQQHRRDAISRFSTEVEAGDRNWREKLHRDFWRLQKCCWRSDR